jgi:hypothetical protein
VQAAARLGHAKWDMLRVVAMMRGSFADQRTAVSRYCTALRDRPWRWRADVRTAGAWVYEADEGLSPMSRSLHGVLFDQHKPPTEWCTSAIAALSVGVLQYRPLFTIPCGQIGVLTPFRPQDSTQCSLSVGNLTSLVIPLRDTTVPISTASARTWQRLVGFGVVQAKLKRGG